MSDNEKKYTKPALRRKIKNKILKSSRGGKPGQWSARKSQMLVREYEEAGGGYVKKKSNCNNLSKWTDQQWGYVLGDTEGRYLPKPVRDRLTRKEKLATNRKKRKAQEAGQKRVKYDGRVAELMSEYLKKNRC